MAEALTFHDRVVIITGAGRGLGRAYALEFARRGAKVLVNDAGCNLDGTSGDRAPADSTAAEITAAGSEALANYSNVANAADARALVDAALRRWGRIDILVNNAGNLRHKPFLETRADDLRSMLESHVLGSLQLSQLVWPHMIAAGYGRIILTSSQVGLYGQANLAGYGAAKAAVIGLMQGMKIAAESTPIKVGVICPFALTRMAPPTFPKSLEGWLGAERVVPAVICMAHQSWKQQGAVVIAGAGHFAVARAIETSGVDFNTLAEITPESLASRIGELTQLQDYRVPTSGIDAVKVDFERLERLEQSRKDTSRETQA